MTDVVEEALIAMEAASAELVDAVSITDIDERIQETALYVPQSRHDLNEFFEACPDAPVDSVRELYNAEVYHEQLDLFDEIAHGPEDPVADPEYWRKVVAQETLRQEIIYAHAEHGLDALVFPDVQVVQSARETVQSGIDTGSYLTNLSLVRSRPIPRSPCRRGSPMISRLVSSYSLHCSTNRCSSSWPMRMNRLQIHESHRNLRRRFRSSYCR